jgi:hypothetical protein
VVPSPAVSSSASQPTDAGSGEPSADWLAQFVRMAPKDPPRDPGVVAPSDAKLLSAAEVRARKCFIAAKETGWVNVYIVLSDDGRATAKPWSGMTRRDVGECAAAAFERDRYTPPGTQTPNGPSVRTLMRRVEHGIPAPQEFQVD